MRKLFFLLALPLSTLGQTINIDTTIELSPLYSGNGNQIITLENEKIFITTAKCNGSLNTCNIYTTKKENGIFSPFQNITPPSVLISEFDITNRGDSIYILLLHGNTLSLIKSTDGGNTFSDTINISQYSFLISIDNISIELNNNGDPIIGYIRKDPYITELIVKTSTDRGESWLPGIDVSDSDFGFFASSSIDFIFHNNDTYILYQEIDNNLTNTYSFIRKSTDFGLSFSSKRMITDSLWNGYPTGTAGISGDIYMDSIFVAFTARNTNSSAIKLVKSTAHINDLNFTSNSRLTNPINNLSPWGTEKYPKVIAVNNFLAVIYCGKILNHRLNVYLSYYQNNLNSFSQPILISDTSIYSEPKLLDINNTNNKIHLSYFSGNGTAYQTYQQLSINGFNLGNINHNIKEKTLSRITNILGQETLPKKNTPLFYIYNNGTVEKRIIIE